jgi:hypothetical protein
VKLPRLAGVAVLAVLTVLAGCGHAAAPAPAGPAPASAPTLALGQIYPTVVDIPAIGVHSTLIQTGLNPDHTVEVPPLDHPEQASWFRYSPAPGQPGPAVLLGHVNAHGTPGVFARLHELRAGDEVNISRVNGDRLVFTVVRVETYPKNAFPTAAVYGDTPQPQLRLITCGGPLDVSHHSYLDNVVVYATAGPTTREGT